MLLAEAPVGPRPLAVVPVGREAETAALKLTQRLREEGFNVELGFGGNVKKRMKRADRIEGARRGHPGRG